MLGVNNVYQIFLEEKFKDLFNCLLNLNGQQLCILLSGGSDSMALLFLVKFFVDEYCIDIDLIALTIDHSLRNESLYEAQLVAKIVSYYNIRHHILTWNRDMKSINNIQCAARNARYDMSSTWCLDNGINYVMTAHHLGDQAETLLMRLFRGSGISGLCSIAREMVINSVVFLRPLLSVCKDDLYMYLFEIGVPFLEDSSNFSHKYERAKYRFLLAELRENFINLELRLGKVADLMCETNNFIEIEKRKLMESVVVRKSNGAICLQNIFLHPAILATRILSDIVQEVGETKLSLGNIVELWLNMMPKNGFIKKTLAGCIIERVSNDIFIYKEFNRYLTDLANDY
ncbi:tRNA(Ile)-lysidine synthase [Candidatus Xenohaliotis californiensis]|uniref:tRNA(Ile)-lysidine synthase n=1 Tax=Candidatus Xenohaliotis californiensis TaxID=84677 RepID=A0ABM9N8X8_9RICK|nr:tRNA(Ile)-lysidine synthase [Candidatus Xenohaliotis californiensis]